MVVVTAVADCEHDFHPPSCALLRRARPSPRISPTLRHRFASSVHKLTRSGIPLSFFFLRFPLALEREDSDKLNLPFRCSVPVSRPRFSRSLPLRMGERRFALRGASRRHAKIIIARLRVSETFTRSERENQDYKFITRTRTASVGICCSLYPLPTNK